MSHDEQIDVHPLEVLEHNLSVQAEPASQDATEQPPTGFAVLSPTGFASVSPTGFAIASGTGFAFMSGTGFAVV